VTSRLEEPSRAGMRQAVELRVGCPTHPHLAFSRLCPGVPRRAAVPVNSRQRSVPLLGCAVCRGWRRAQGSGSGDERSTTQSTISAATTTITSGNSASQVTLDKLNRGATNDASAGQLAQGWDGQKLGQQAKLNAQIVADFGAQASKEIGAEFGKKAVAVKTEAGKLAEGDPNRQALLDEAAKYDEGGAYRIAAHAVVGGLTGNVQGALGAATAASLAPELQKLQGSLQKDLEALSVPKDKPTDQEKSPAEALSKLITGAIAGVAGGVVGGASGAAAGLNEDFNNRQLHPSERQLAQQLAKKSGGKYTVEQIEDAMRNSGNSVLNESIVTGMLVRDDKNPNQYYDKGAPFTTYDGGKTFVQVNRDGSQLGTQPIDPGLAAYIRANTGGSDSPYTAFAPAPAMPPVSASGVAANGLRYEMRTANGQSFRLAIADCPAVSCQNTDNVARYGLSPEDQQQVQAYDAALNKQTIKGVSTIAVLGAAAPLAVEGLAANVLLGGAVGGTISAKDQYIDDGKVDAGKTVKDAAVGAIATGAVVVAAPVVAAGARNLGQTLDEVAAAKVVSQAEIDAAAAAQQAAKVGNNFSRDDGSYFAETYQSLRDRVSQARSQVPELVDSTSGKPGNMAVAEINVYGKGSETVQANSRIGNDMASVRDGFVSLPPEELRILQPKQNPLDPIPREMDTEFKILENFAQKNVGNPQVQGSINLYTERPPCDSCTNLIQSQFAEKFPNMEVRVYHGNGEVTVYKGGVPETVTVPSNNKNQWPAAPDLPTPPKNGRKGNMSHVPQHDD
jgi:The  BURPS668_1122 family of deaminases